MNHDPDATNQRIPNGPAQPGHDGAPEPASTQPMRSAPMQTQPVGAPAAQGGGWGAPAPQDGSPSGAPAGSPGSRRRRNTPALVAAGLVGALALGGGAAFAFVKLTGSGAQPSDVMPADTFAYVRLDVDPSMGQKVSAVRFFNSLPQKAQQSIRSSDVRKGVIESILKDASTSGSSGTGGSGGASCTAGLTYDKDFKPWLGERVGLGAAPGGAHGAMPIIAIQASDPARGKQVVERIASCGGELEATTRDDYVLLTTKGDAGALSAAIGKGTLSSNTTFTADMNALGDPGVASLWMDMSRTPKDLLANGVAPGVTGSEVSPAKGRIAAAARFDPDYVEIAGITRGVSGTAVPGGPSEIAKLPDDTVAAVQLNNGSAFVDKVWPTIKDAMDSTGESGTSSDPFAQAGLTMPDDLKTLLGSSLVIAVPNQDFSSQERIGAKLTTNDAPKAKDILDRLMTQAASDSSAPASLPTKVDGNTLYAATDQSYLHSLSQGGTLGSTDTYKKAIPNDKDLTFAVYVDIEKLAPQITADMKDDEKRFVQGIKAVGGSATTSKDGNGTFTFRVVAR